MQAIAFVTSQDSSSGTLALPFTSYYILLKLVFEWNKQCFQVMLAVREGRLSVKVGASSVEAGR